MEIKINEAGNLELNIKDLLQNLDDEQAEVLIQALAWDSRMWKVIKDVVNNEHAAFSYNEDLLKLRLAFLTEDDGDFRNPYTRVADVVAALLTEIDRQRESAMNADKSFWTIYRQMSGIARERGIKIETPKHTPLRFYHSAAREIAEKYMSDDVRSGRGGEETATEVFRRAMDVEFDDDNLVGALTLYNMATQLYTEERSPNDAEVSQRMAQIVAEKIASRSSGNKLDNGE